MAKKNGFTDPKTALHWAGRKPKIHVRFVEKSIGKSAEITKTALLKQVLSILGEKTSSGILGMRAGPKNHSPPPNVDNKSTS